MSSSNAIKPGKIPKRHRVREAKLSSILRGVRVVARRNSAKGWGGSSGSHRMPFSITQSPFSSLALCASIRE